MRSHPARFHLTIVYSFHCENCIQQIPIDFLEWFSLKSVSVFEVECSKCGSNYSVKFEPHHQIPEALLQWSEDYKQRYVSLNDEAVRLSDLLQVTVENLPQNE